MLNSSQRKHLASSLRIIAIAQFVNYGWISIKTDNDFIAIISITVYFYLEFFALYVLRKGV